MSDKFGWRRFTVGGMMFSAAGLAILTPRHGCVAVMAGNPRHCAGELRDGAVLLAQLQFGAQRGGARQLRRGFGAAEYGAHSANVISLAIATTIVTVTMGSLGYEPSLEAVRNDAVAGVRGAFTVGMRYAFLR